MKSILITSDSLRHKYIAHCLLRETELQLVISEKKSPKIRDFSGFEKQEASFINHHFNSRDDAEQLFFKDFREFPEGTPVLTVEHGEINTAEIEKTIGALSPDFVVLFGSSILKLPLWEKFGERIINLHLGLSPYYRGSATNLYPYYFEEPECVGATIHLATAQVDQGAVLHQLRPEIREDQDLHQIGNQVIKQSGEVLPTVLQQYRGGKISPVKQQGAGKLCRNSDITPEVLRTIYAHFKNGMIQKYLREKGVRDQAKPIIYGLQIGS